MNKAKPQLYLPVALGLKATQLSPFLAMKMYHLAAAS